MALPPVEIPAPLLGGTQTKREPDEVLFHRIAHMGTHFFHRAPGFRPDIRSARPSFRSLDGVSGLEEELHLHTRQLDDVVVL